MAPKAPPLGSQAVYTPPSQIYPVSESLCTNLSVFKDLMKEHRRLDDSVTMRMNRNSAFFRDKDRLGKGASTPEESCTHFWHELVANWNGRTEIINYCVDVVDRKMEEKRKALEGQESKLDAERSKKSTLYADQVKRNQIHNEHAVETIVRRRSFEAFKSRCKYFEPPLSDAEARKWWDAASAGQ
ncbi:hypothetical protein BOTBODRAFT_31678 [Botryobasidium botryosum FD-172 SS1]|uniref:Caffeine-induced death protein 2 n=1 Tax=Botryobasidium botryosum (strain FD-172 SS1) TaxID=930990 RepID=A0A067MIM1_BOTB1|nr:hypothetical protein BOTBODRAFT_31678 [Botryobasidium botryosum FD-172 SS1]